MNTVGTIFRVSIFGESHGHSVGVVIDGCPAGLPFWKEELMADLSRRKGLLPGTTARRESDEPVVISGIINDFTTGAPLVLCTRNNDFKPGDYEQFTSIPRPGHADFTAGFKYKGFSDMRGGGALFRPAYMGPCGCRLLRTKDSFSGNNHCQPG